MKLMSCAIIYLIFLFHLGTGAVVNMEQMLTEETNTVVRRVLKEMIEEIQADRMSENNVADINTQNKQLTTGESEHGDLQRELTLGCSWRRNRGTCCQYINYIKRLCVQLTISGSGIFVEPSRNGYTFDQKFIRGSGVIRFKYNEGYLHLDLTVSIVRTNLNIKTCIRLRYNIGFRHFSQDLGCNNKRWHSNENHSVNNFGRNIKNPVDLQEFDNQPYNDGFFDLISDGIPLTEGMVEELRSDRTVENKVGISHNEQSATKGSKIRDVQVRRLNCIWEEKTGNCSVSLENLPWLYVNITAVPTGIHFLLSLGPRLISNFFINGDRTKDLNETMGPAELWLQISVKNNTSHYIKVCFFLKYTVSLWIWSGSLGCPSRSFPTSKENNTPITTTKAPNKNFQHPLKFQKFDPVMGDRVVENIVDEKSN